VGTLSDVATASGHDQNAEATFLKEGESHMSKDRKSVLLRAAYDLMWRADENGYLQVPGMIEVRYDSVNCDGHCLMSDICNELGLDED